jgi:selenocysteine lyase/cysteine desulfurase
MEIAEAQRLWNPETTYLNTASYGLPPAPAWEALQGALADWRGGRTSWEHWGEATERSRESFARLVNVPVERVAAGSTVSEVIGLLAASLPDGARVVAPDIDFASLLFPFMVEAERRGGEVRTVPLDGLAEAIDSATDVVATSAVQMATGELADLDAVVEAARRHGARIVVDATQACGWLPLDASRFDGVVCAGYKWLMSPRGSTFLAVAQDWLADIPPHAAGWYAGEDVHETYYGPPLRLAADARRLDVSPAWFSWVGTEPALALVERLGVEAIHAHNLELANAFREGLGLPPGDSAIVMADTDLDAARLAESGVMAAVRGGRLRTSWHVYNTSADVDRALAALRGQPR